MGDADITGIWDECERELEANRKSAANFQLALEQTIGNIAALKLLEDDRVEEAVKN